MTFETTVDPLLLIVDPLLLFGNSSNFAPWPSVAPSSWQDYKILRDACWPRLEATPTFRTRKRAEVALHKTTDRKQLQVWQTDQIWQSPGKAVPANMEVLQLGQAAQVGECPCKAAMSFEILQLR